MSEDEFKKLFKFYKETDANGLERIYMFPKDFVEQSIIALTRTDPTHPTGYANGIVPTGRYLAPASGTGLRAVPRWPCAPAPRSRGSCEGPWFFRTDMSFVKRFNTGKRTWIEARMDIFNVFDNVNFVATTRAPTRVTLPATRCRAGR